MILFNKRYKHQNPNQQNPPITVQNQFKKKEPTITSGSLYENLTHLFSQQMVLIILLSFFSFTSQVNTCPLIHVYTAIGAFTLLN